MESWKERGVPLHVALRGIEQAFDSHEAKKHKRSVKTLLYCEEEVEAQYAEWLESRVGSHDKAQDSEGEDADRESPFPRQAVLAHLARSLDQLIQQCKNTSADELNETLSRAARLLSEIKDDYESAAQPNPSGQRIRRTVGRDGKGNQATIASVSRAHGEGSLPTDIR